MKTYLFDTKTGVYEGESFEEPAMLEYEDGLTTTAPPDYEHGQVPVFDRQKNAWAVIPVSVARQLLNIRPASSRESKI
jgi:hypothetical protein